MTLRSTSESESSCTAGAVIWCISSGSRNTTGKRIPESTGVRQSSW